VIVDSKEIDGILGRAAGPVWVFLSCSRNANDLVAAVSRDQCPMYLNNAKRTLRPDAVRVVYHQAR
jgi:hypothetical protein